MARASRGRRGRLGLGTTDGHHVREAPRPDIAAGLRHELEAEQAYVGLLYVQLDTLRARAAESLEAVRRAPIVPTPSGRAERDAFDSWHSERIARLASVEDRLAFGRLDLSGGERRYVGRIGLSDDAQAQLLLDWRAPAAAAFYQATPAHPDGVVRRRHLATLGRRVTGIDDELLDARALAESGLATVAGEGALMSALTAHRTGRMRDIVATLQSEQDRVVRAPLPGVLVVQGGPGTGKTAVALHRAAYLLYTHRDRIARSGVLVVGPSPVFLRYIEQVLPSLGETGVVLSTPGRLFPGVDTTRHDRPGVALVKGDPRMAEVIRRAVRSRARHLAADVRLDLDGDRLVLRTRVVAEARARARQAGRPHNEARISFVRHVLDDLAAQLGAARGHAPEDGERADLLAELRDSRDVRREINLLWLPQTATGLVGRLLTRADRLLEAADGVLTPAEQTLLLRAADAGWTVEDVPLLDEAAELIGADVAVSAAERTASARAAAERAEALVFARRVLGNAGDAEAMMTPEMLADRFAEGGPALSVADRARDDRNWAFGHAVVDEAQELSPMMWRLIGRRVPSRSMTVVGDVAQTGSAAGTTSWAAVLEPLAAGRWRVEQLSVNYRTPGAVMAVAARMLAEHGITVPPTRTARDGDWEPATVRVGDPDALASAATDAVLADEAALGGGRFAVILPREGFDAVAAAVRERLGAGAVPLASAGGEAAGDPLGARVDVLGVDEVKGLEFDGVVVVEPAAVLAQSARGVNDLYVALTRPIQRLTIVHHDALPAGLAGPGDAAPGDTLF